MLLSSPIGAFVRERDGWCFDPRIATLDVDPDLEIYLGDLPGRLQALSRQDAPDDLEARLARASVETRPPLRTAPMPDSRAKAQSRAAPLSRRRIEQARLRAGLHRLEALAPELGALRTRRVRVLEKGPKGGIACAPARAIPERLKDLSAFIARNRQRSWLLTAIYAYALFLLIHPYEDENGRTARQLFAAMLQTGDDGGAPLAISSVIILFEGEMSERMSNLVFRGSWAEFVSRISEIMRTYIDLSIEVTMGDYGDRIAG